MNNLVLVDPTANASNDLMPRHCAEFSAPPQRGSMSRNRFLLLSANGVHNSCENVRLRSISRSVFVR